MSVKWAFSKIVPWAAGGAGVAALENKFVGDDNLSPPLQNINLGLGGLTGGAIGGLLAKDKPVEAAMIAAGYPLKSMLLFGTGAMDKLRRQQQALTDTNLQTARINQRTALTEGSNSGAKRRMAAAFLIPALLGGGGLAYYAWQHRKKHIPDRFKTLSEKGTPHGRQRVRIDIPSSAFPDDFFHSLVNAEESPKAFTRVQEAVNNAQQLMKQQSVNHPDAVSVMTKWAMAGEEDHPSTLRSVMRILPELTGIPSLARGVREIPTAFNALAQGKDSDAARYGLGGVGNLLGGTMAMGGFMLPGIGKLLGRTRLSSLLARSLPMVRRPAAAGPLSLFDRMVKPFAKTIWRHTYADEMQPGRAMGAGTAADPFRKGLMRGGVEYANQAAARSAQGLSNKDPVQRALRMKFRTDPNRFGWKPPPPFVPASYPRIPSGLPPAETAAYERWAQDYLKRNPATPPRNISGGIKQLLFGAPRTPATTLPGQLMTTGKYLTNKALNFGYGAKQFMGRHPYITGSAVTWPLAGMGLSKDQEMEDAAKQNLKGYLPQWEQGRGPGGMPISRALGSLLGVFGNNQNSAVGDQIRGHETDPWPNFR